jgi:hypothetical protein
MDDQTPTPQDPTTSNGAAVRRRWALKSLGEPGVTNIRRTFAPTTRKPNRRRLQALT